MLKNDVSLPSAIRQPLPERQYPLFLVLDTRFTFSVLVIRPGIVFFSSNFVLTLAVFHFIIILILNIYNTYISFIYHLFDTYLLKYVLSMFYFSLILDFRTIYYYLCPIRYNT